jgi:hypothetical protein
MAMKRTLASAIWVLILALEAAAGVTHPNFIQDDFKKAEAEALQRRLPIFVEVWAPW